MSFLAPIFLAGALAISLPVLFHLIRRSVRERTVFSSLMFLQPSVPRLTRRSRLENLLLLALRCAAILFLATGFARPFLKRAFPPSAPSTPGRRVVVLLDTSASMRRQNVWNSARQKADSVLRGLRPADTLALCSFDDHLRTLISFDEWVRFGHDERLALARSRLADLKPGWAGTALDSALIEAAEVFGGFGKDLSPGGVRIVVISDFQEGSRVAALQGHEWPKGIEIVPEPVTAQRGNAGLQLTGASAETAGADTAVRFRVINASDSTREQFQAGWGMADGSWRGQPVDIYVPAGQSRMVSLPVPGTNAPANRLLLRGDSETFDDTLFIVPPEKNLVTILYLGEESEADATQPLFFLQTAMQNTPRQTIRFVKVPAGSLLQKSEVESAALIVATRGVAREQAGILRDAIAAGKTLLFAPVNAAAGASLSDLLTPGAPLQVTDYKPADYALLGQIQFTHPLFAPFADSRFSDFTGIHFWQYRKLDLSGLPGARSLARFDSGDPALFEVPLGKGRVLALMSGWNPADSQLALSSKFVPFLFSLLELGNSAAPAVTQFLVGQTVSVESNATVRLPNGANAALKPGETNLVFEEPGLYSIASPAGSRLLAANLEPAESRTGPMPVDALERLGVPGPHPATLARHEAERQVRLQNAEVEARQKLWRWFIVATLALVAAESWLAGRTTRRALPLEGT